MRAYHDRIRVNCTYVQGGINLFEDELGLVDCVRDGDSRAGQGLLPISFSFRAARIVAAKRIAYFRCSSIA